VLLAAASVFLVVFECTPVSRFWNDAGGDAAALLRGGGRSGQCMTLAARQRFYNANGIANIVQDCAVYALPVAILAPLRMPLRQKLACIAVMSVGGVAVVAACVRYYFVSRLDQDDFYYLLGDSLNWCSIELYFAIIGGSASTFKVLLKRWFPRVWGTDAESGPSRIFGGLSIAVVHGGGGSGGGGAKSPRRGSPAGVYAGTGHRYPSFGAASDGRFPEFDVPMRNLQPTAKRARRGGKQGIRDITLVAAADETAMHQTRRGSEDSIILALACGESPGAAGDARPLRRSSAGWSSAATTVVLGGGRSEDELAHCGGGAFDEAAGEQLQRLQAVVVAVDGAPPSSRAGLLEEDDGALPGSTPPSAGSRAGIADLDRWRTSW
jgi:hypothetical protein